MRVYLYIFCYYLGLAGVAYTQGVESQAYGKKLSDTELNNNFLRGLVPQELRYKKPVAANNEVISLDFF